MRHALFAIATAAFVLASTRPASADEEDLDVFVLHEHSGLASSLGHRDDEFTSRAGRCHDRWLGADAVLHRSLAELTSGARVAYFALEPVGAGTPRHALGGGLALGATITLLHLPHETLLVHLDADLLVSARADAALVRSTIAAQLRF